MDHTMPDHTMPGHGDHSGGSGGGHEGHIMPATCKTSMLFTWEYKDVCVVFPWWHIHGAAHLVLSIAAIFALAAGYEYLKYSKHKFESEAKLLSPGGSGLYDNKVPGSYKLKSSLYYGALVGYSFMLMLVFMSFNGWLMGAVVAGAFFGHYVWSESARQVELADSVDSLACH